MDINSVFWICTMPEVKLLNLIIRATGLLSDITCNESNTKNYSTELVFCI